MRPQELIQKGGKKIYYKFPYIEGLSEKVGNLMKNQASNINLAFYPLTKLENIYTKLKDSFPKLMTSNLVTKFLVKIATYRMWA